MKRAASVFLHADITRQDACAIIGWLENKHVTRYLNESPQAADWIRSLLNSRCPVLTPAFNQNGRFFILRIGNTDSGHPVGFVKLVSKATGEHEIVVVIGDDRLWGRGYGRSAVQKSLQRVFLDWRAQSVVANIHPGNHHSIRLFEKSGFHRERHAPQSHCVRYRITMEEYLSSQLEANRKIS